MKPLNITPCNATTQPGPGEGMQSNRRSEAYRCWQAHEDEKCPDEAPDRPQTSMQAMSDSTRTSAAGHHLAEQNLNQ